MLASYQTWCNDKLRGRGATAPVPRVPQLRGLRSSCGSAGTAGQKGDLEPLAAQQRRVGVWRKQDVENDSLHFSLQAIELTSAGPFCGSHPAGAKDTAAGAHPPGPKTAAGVNHFLNVYWVVFCFCHPPKQRGSGRAATPLRKRSDHFSSLGSLLALQTV